MPSTGPGRRQGLKSDSNCCYFMIIRTHGAAFLGARGLAVGHQRLFGTCHPETGACLPVAVFATKNAIV